MSPHIRRFYCYNCSKALPKAAVRCPWCSSARISHVPRHLAHAGDLGGIDWPNSFSRQQSFPTV